MPAPVILFDLDGTLADTAPDLARALNHVLAEMGLDRIEPETVRQTVGLGARRLIQEGLERRGHDADEAEVDRLVGRFIDFYRDNIALESTVFPGVPEALDRLRRSGARLAVCTNKFEDLSNRLLRALSLSDYFDFVAGADTFAVRKPDPGHILQAIERVSGRPERAVMVGDSETDVAAARAARVPVVGVTFGYTRTPIRELAPDAVIEHFDALLPALERLLGPLPDLHAKSTR